jgi:hypothetical protein
MRPSHMFSKHPALVAALGTLVGVVIFRHPVLIGKALTRAVRFGLPFLPEVRNIAKVFLK